MLHRGIVRRLLLHVVRVCAADALNEGLATLRLPSSAAACVRQLAMGAILLQPAARVSLGVTDCNAAVAAAKLPRAITHIR